MHARSRSLSAALAFVSLVHAARAEDAPAAPETTRIPLEARDVPASRTLWYGLYVGGVKSGWVHEVFAKEGTGEGAVLVWTLSAYFEATSQGRPVEVQFVERLEFDSAPPFAIRSAVRTKAQGPNREVVTIRRGAEVFETTVETNGNVRSLEAAAMDLTLADALTPERWIQSKPAVGAAISVRELDLSRLRPDVVTYTLLARKKTVIDGVEAGYYEVGRSSRRKGPRGVRRLDDAGLLLSIDLGDAFEARREPEEKAKTLEAGSDLFVLGIAKVEGQIAPTFDEVPKVADLVLEAKGDGAAFLRTGPRQTVERDEVTGTTILRLGASHGTPDEASPEEIADGLAETVAYPTKDRRVVAMATEAVRDAKTPKEKVARLVAFVADYLEDEAWPAFVPVVALLDTKAGDCTEHAELFATLARAAAIPAREVSGLMYMGDEVRAFGGHAWNEVVLDGRWVPVDATHAEVELDATHVTLGREGAKSSEWRAASRLAFKVVSSLRTAKPGQPAYEEPKDVDDVDDEEPAATPAK